MIPAPSLLSLERQAERTIRYLWKLRHHPQAKQTARHRLHQEIQVLRDIRRKLLPRDKP